jgi:hypothetical protein
MKFKVTEASDYHRRETEKEIRTLRGLKRFTEEAFKDREDMFDGGQEIIISFKKRTIIIYDDYVE